MRRAGLAESRPQGGVDEWPAEDEYWSARNTLRYEDRLDRRKFGPWDPAGFGGAFRRLFWPEATLPRCRFDLGITNTGGGRDRRRSHHGFGRDFGARDARQILRDFLEMPVRIAAEGKLERHQLGKAANPLARLILHSTTRWKDRGKFELHPWWLSAGNPMCVLEYGYTEQGAPPPNSVTIEENEDFNLHFAVEQVCHRNWATWFLEVKTPWSPSVRLIRLHLGRLHAEMETLRSVLELLVGDDTADLLATPGRRSDALDTYLRRAVGVLSRSAHYGLDTPQILNSAYEFGETTGRQQMALLEALIDAAAVTRPVLVPLLDRDNPARQAIDKAPGGIYPKV